MKNYLVLFIVLILVSCGIFLFLNFQKSDVEIIQEAKYNGITYKELFENYKYYESVEWKDTTVVCKLDVEELLKLNSNKNIIIQKTEFEIIDNENVKLNDLYFMYGRVGTDIDKKISIPDKYYDSILMRMKNNEGIISKEEILSQFEDALDDYISDFQGKISDKLKSLF